MLTRLLICGVLGLVVAVQASAAPVSPHAPVIEITIFQDGSIRVEGHRYASADAAKTELLSISQRKPTPEITFVVSRDTPFSALGRAIQLLESAGVARVGFLTEPENVEQQKH